MPSSPEPIATVPVPACPACGGAGPVAIGGLADRLHGVGGRWAFRRCGRCGSLWLDPRPADDQLGRLYPPAYFTHEATDPTDGAAGGWRAAARASVLAGWFGYPAADGAARRAVGRALGAVPAIRDRAAFGTSSVFPRYVAGGRVLDVGCGSGAFLALLRSHGWTPAGVEPDPAAREAASSRGLDVAPSLEDAAGWERFDVVTMTHVLEHVPEPIAFLERAVERLRPGGRLLAVTPNAQSLGLRLFGRDWFALEVPRHLAVYSPRGARALLGRVRGLRHVRVGTSARIAAKMAREAARVRRLGRFKADEPLGSLADVALPRAFGAAEALARLAAEVGEEIVVEAAR
jgi:2-polyprenyl-3-methyl-5-hydroxy-6-metoxy-1,4-benzoquinol methylase